MTNLIEMSKISKAFGGSVALRGVSLELLPGSVHALMGENGAGKSTLMKILAGVHQPDSGEIFKNGHKIAFANPREALEFGISTVFQELSLLPNLTIAENMFLGREPVNRLGLIDYARMGRQTKEALAELGLHLDPSTLVSELSIAERQFVEIAHGIDADARIFILDEPTAALNAADVEILNAQIRRLRDEGKAIVYISHRMDEIFAICDTVTVLKDGQLVGTRPLAEMTPSSLIAMMVGRELEDLFPERAKVEADVALELQHLKIEATSRPFSISVRKGEIVALAGLEGQGQQKILGFAQESMRIGINMKAVGGTAFADRSGVKEMDAQRIRHHFECEGELVRFFLCAGKYRLPLPDIIQHGRGRYDHDFGHVSHWARGQFADIVDQATQTHRDFGRRLVETHLEVVCAEHDDDQVKRSMALHAGPEIGPAILESAFNGVLVNGRPAAQAFLQDVPPGSQGFFQDTRPPLGALISLEWTATRNLTVRV